MLINNQLYHGGPGFFFCIAYILTCTSSFSQCVCSTWYMLIRHSALLEFMKYLIWYLIQNWGEGNDDTSVNIL